MNRSYIETPQYVEYMLTKPLWLKGIDKYNQHLGTAIPISWDEEGQVERFKPNAFDKEDEYGEEFNWDYFPAGAHKINSKLQIMGIQDFARFMNSLPPLPPVVPVTKEQMEEWFQPWEIKIHVL